MTETLLIKVLFVPVEKKTLSHMIDVHRKVDDASSNFDLLIGVVESVGVAVDSIKIGSFVVVVGPASINRENDSVVAHFSKIVILPDSLSQSQSLSAVAAVLNPYIHSLLSSSKFLRLRDGDTLCVLSTDLTATLILLQWVLFLGVKALVFVPEISDQDNIEKRKLHSGFFQHKHNKQYSGNVVVRSFESIVNYDSVRTMNNIRLVERRYAFQLVDHILEATGHLGVTAIYADQNVLKYLKERFCCSESDFVRSLLSVISPFGRIISCTPLQHFGEVELDVLFQKSLSFSFFNPTALLNFGFGSYLNSLWEVISGITDQKLWIPADREIFKYEIKALEAAEAMKNTFPERLVVCCTP